MTEQPDGFPWTDDNTRLGKELRELEATDPIVRAAREGLDLAIDKLTTPAIHGDVEIRLFNRRCRCNKPLAEIRKNCIWHDQARSQYIQDLQIALVQFAEVDDVSD